MLELAGIIILGIFAQWIAWRFKIPAILPLILIGLFVGPISTLISEDGTQWIQPIWNTEKGFFPGESLFYFVSLAIGIILFEGGLTLKLGEIKKVGGVIGKLISLGSAITFFGAGAAAHYAFGLSWKISFLFAALVIVTGPTVITPILRNIPLKKDVSAVLKWEGILIDPIGALVAVLVFGFISVNIPVGMEEVATESMSAAANSHEGQAGGGSYTKHALIEFGKIVVVGFAFGLAGGFAMYHAVKRKVIPHYLLNVASLSLVLLIFVLSDLFAHESGLLSVVVMGMYLGNTDLPNLKELLYFKESLSVLLISILFILLAANISIDDLMLIYNWKTAVLFAVVIFIIRPIGVFLSTLGSNLKTNEKVFISWVGPRGIVAAGIASLFGTKLVELGVPGAEYITPLVFGLVLVTVLLNATTARMVASLLGVFLKKSEGVMIVGGSRVSRLIASYLQKNDRHVVLVDSNRTNVQKAKELGIDAINANIYSDDLTDNIELNDVGYLLAMTGNDEINRQAMNRFGKQFGENGTFRLMTSEELLNNDESNKEDVFSNTHDYIRFTEVARDYPSIQEIEVDDHTRFLKVLETIRDNDDAIPLFIKNSNGNLELIDTLTEFDIEKGSAIAYLGKPIDFEDVVIATNEDGKLPTAENQNV
ncbi:cation:proton antiporter [Marinirhabdus gelatinilytica]|uniref:Sodium/proton antiporter (CPA1 family) n=1 Tax=Marinirhabdus gelatinilytica TaxID=1703343 RepID=A0A370QJE2_9FLAO|nr:sodium:proton antiporter [Marinirhabdus gelatinilytica]RDK88461.1 sodium/proton antiporter (CPA1 family) [Marinirhabdus gelatinilytica]